MFSSIGFGELAIICIVLIIAVGPERLPTMMKTVGKTVRTLRQASRDIRSATGIDEMMRDEAFDLNSRPRPYKQPPNPSVVSRTPQVAPVPSASSGDATAAAPTESSSAAEPTSQAASEQATTEIAATKPEVTDAK